MPVFARAVHDAFRAPQTDPIHKRLRTNYRFGAKVTSITHFFRQEIK